MPIDFSPDHPPWFIPLGLACPACQRQSLCVIKTTDGARLMCTHLTECPNPTAAAFLLQPEHQIHIAQFDGVGVTLQHPLIERLGGGLFSCRLLNQLQAIAGVEKGRYEVTIQGEVPLLARIEE